MSIMMSRFRDTNAMPEIEYVLELPVDRAKIVSDELIRLGVPNDRIKVVEPGRSKSPPPPPAMNSVYSKDKQPSKSEKTVTML